MEGKKQGAKREEKKEGEKMGGWRGKREIGEKIHKGYIRDRR